MVPTCRCIGQHAVTWLKELEDIAFSPFARRERKLHKTKATALSSLGSLTFHCLPLGWSRLIRELWLIGEQKSADEPGEWETSVSACIYLKGSGAVDRTRHKETKYAFYRKPGRVSFPREAGDFLSRAWPRRFTKATNQAKKADKLKHNAETEQADPRDVRWKRLRSGGRDWRRRTSCPHVNADSCSAPESRFLCSPVIPHPSDSPRKPHKSVLSLPSTGDKSTWRLAWCIVQNVNNNKCC